MMATTNTNQLTKLDLVIREAFNKACADLNVTPSLVVKAECLTKPAKTLRLGDYSTRTNTVTVYVMDMVKKASRSNNFDNLLLNLAEFTVYHECRHAWQAVHVDESYYRLDMFIAYANQDLEVDANGYAMAMMQEVEYVCTLPSIAMSTSSSPVVINAIQALDIDNINKGEDNMSISSTNTNTTNKNNKGVVSMSKTVKGRGLERLTESRTNMAMHFTVAALENIAKARKVDLELVVGKRYDKATLVEYMVDKVFFTESARGNVRVVRFGSQWFAVQKDRYEDTGILNDEHVLVADSYKDNETFDFVDLSKERIYLVKNEADMFNLFVLENTREKGALTAKVHVGDVYIPNMKVLSQYFDAVIITSQFVKAVRNKVGFYTARTSKVYLSEKKHVVMPSLVNNIRAKEQKREYDELTIKLERKGNVVDVAQVRIDKLEINDGRFAIESSSDENFVLIGESEVTDELGENATYIKETKKGEKIETAYRRLPEYMVLDCNIPSADDSTQDIIEDRLEKIYMYGMMVDMTHPVKGFAVKGLFTQITRSASQSRSGSIWMVKIADSKVSKEEVERLRIDKKMELAEGKNYYGKEIVPVKVDNVISLMFSTSKRVYSKEEMKEVLKRWDVMTIEDCEIETEETWKELVTKGKGQDTEYEINEVKGTFNRKPHDGQNHANLTVMAEIAYKLGLISLADMLYIVELFNNSFRRLDMMKSNLTKRARRIMKAIPSLYQIRGGVIKGTLILADIKSWAKGTPYEDASIIFGDSSVKDADRKNIFTYLRVCGYSKAPKKLNMNYQFIESLELEGNDLISLAQSNIDELSEVRSNPAKAIEFLGAYMNVDDDVDTTDEKDVARKLEKILVADHNMLYTAYVQNKLFDLMRKKITDMRFGRITLNDGCYQYVVSDPRTLFNQTLGLHNNELKGKTAYWNNKTGKYAAFRAPLAYKACGDVLELAEDDELWFYNNIMILSAYCATLQRLSGADTDGDKFAITNNPIILNAAKNYVRPFLYTGKFSAKKVAYTSEVELRLYKNAYVTSGVGMIANYHTIIRDVELCEKVVMIEGLTMVNGRPIAKTGAEIRVILDTYEMILDQLEGKEIDKVKTNENVVIPQNLKVKTKSHWMKDIDLFFNPLAKELVKGEDYYISTSPMGKLYTFIAKTILIQDTGDKDARFTGTLELKGKTIAEEKLSAIHYSPVSAWFELVDYSVVESIYDEMKTMVKEYNMELAKLMEARNELVKSDLKEEDVEKKMKEQFEFLYNSFKTDFENYGERFGHENVAYCVYNATEKIVEEKHEHKGKSLLVGHSCPWVTVFDTIYNMILLSGNKSVLVKINTDAHKVIVNNNGDIIADGEIIRKETNVKPGVYSVVNGNKYSFIQVPRDVETIVDARKELKSQELGLRKSVEDRPTTLVRVWGLDKYGLTADEFIKNNVTFGLMQTKYGVVAVAKTEKGLKTIGKTNIAKNDDSNEIKRMRLSSALVNSLVKIVGVLSKSSNGNSMTIKVVAVGELDSILTKVQVVNTQEADIIDIDINADIPMPEETIIDYTEFDMQTVVYGIEEVEESEVEIEIADDEEVNSEEFDTNEELDAFNQAFGSLSFEAIAMAQNNADFNSDAAEIEIEL